MSKESVPHQAGDYQLVLGASWMTLTGDVYLVPGFHIEWLKKYQDEVGAYSSVAELILDKRWISLMLYNRGYLEVYINSVHDQEVAAALWKLLYVNSSVWSQLLIIALEEDRYVHFNKNDVVSWQGFLQTLGKGDPLEPGVPAGS
ncbi:MAG: hypothetical protein K9L68_05995 [Spirochaetales bacterium]|nr:hypothetical protein [Spirochaetales bacterium]MCF7938133.1 hypothetical protein [Spirochaetales bacterium]